MRVNRGSWVALAALAGVGLAGVVFAQDLPPRCTGLCRPDRRGHFVARADLLRPAGVNGDDLRVIVDRSPGGVLAPGYAPLDLVDLSDLRARRPHECTPPATQCLRRDAALAYRVLADAMRAAGHRPYVSSAFRSYPVQCSTFLGWARRERAGFCGAVTASALPGHSQHQLGTTLDLFTRDWMDGGNKFRAGFGCSPGGRWLAEHAHEYGFVLPYPLHPAYRQTAGGCAAVRGAEERIDPRTGYRYEPWHLRFIGVTHTERFRAAWRASGPGTVQEITLDQWLRQEAGRGEHIAAPVCDGCNCDRCATYSNATDRPCRNPALTLSPSGVPESASGPPQIRDARLSRDEEGRLILEARLALPANTLTQPPILSRPSGGHFAAGRAGPQLGPAPHPSFAPLDGAWRLAVGLGAGQELTHRAALAEPERDDTPNGLNARFPAPPGELEMEIVLLGVSPGAAVRVGLSGPGGDRGLRTLRAP